jgi:agmatinase
MKTLPIDRNFLGIEDEHATLDRAGICVLSAPYERTVSYGRGTAGGPAALLEASHYVEFWDEEYERELCFERGVAALEPLDFSGLDDAAALDAIEAAVGVLLERNAFVATIGGEHTIAAPCVRAHLRRFPRMSVLQFDAHSDLRLSYEGTPLSHASAMARVVDTLDPARLTQVGIRAQCREEFALIRDRGVHTFFARDIRRGVHGADWQARVVDTLAQEVYVSFDIDALDPAIMPATGTPEPGGLWWDETLDLLRSVGSARRIVGFDLVEVAPDERHPHAAFLAAKLAYKMMNAAFQRR